MPYFWGASVADQPERDQEIVRRTAELLAANLPMAQFFAQMQKLLRRFFDARTVLLAVTENGAAIVEYLANDAGAGRPANPAVRADSCIDRVMSDGKPRHLKGKQA